MKSHTLTCKQNNSGDMVQYLAAASDVEIRQPPTAEGQILDGTIGQLHAVGDVQSVKVPALLDKLLDAQVSDLVALGEYHVTQVVAVTQRTQALWAK